MNSIALACLAICILVVQVGSVPLPDPDIPTGYEIFQNDMLMASVDVKAASEGKDVDARFKSETGIKGNENLNTGQAAVAMDRNRWTNGIVPYTLSSQVEESWFGLGNLINVKSSTQKAIEAAIQEWQAKTCIKFVERTTERDYIYFINDGIGKCYSHVGRIGGKQALALGMGCRNKGTALHEIGHALGLHHEQSRPDRNKYVEIEYENIADGMARNFDKYEFSQINTLGARYDYNSIMHYAEDAFAKWPWQDTIKVKQSGVSIGQRERLSGQDIAQINKWYAHECSKQ